jgi:hypothetical protein
VPIKNTAQRPEQTILKGGDRCLVGFEASSTAPSEIPPLKLQAQNITDPGVVRLGNSAITSAR